MGMKTGKAGMIAVQAARRAHSCSEGTECGPATRRQLHSPEGGGPIPGGEEAGDEAGGFGDALEVGHTCSEPGGEASYWFSQAENRRLTSVWNQMADLQQQTPKEGPPLLAKRALFCLDINNKFRVRLVRIVKSKAFDRVILILIALNCVTLAMDSKAPNFEKQPLGKALEPIEYVFLGAFTTEMVMKILSIGFFWHPGSYLRDGWNVMDFSVVVLGWLAFIPSFGNYTAIRVVRVFRPLRTITGVEGMRLLVVTLFRSLPMLFDVLILCAFAFFIFGIVGIQLFSGVLRNRCGYPLHLNNTAVAVDSMYEVPLSQSTEACSGRMSKEIEWDTDISVDPMVHRAVGGTSGLGRMCPDAPTESYPNGLFCTEYGNPHYGITSFDSIFWAWLTIFQCISMEGWVDIMYMVQDAVSPWVWIYFVVLIVFGSFFAVNLALAVLYLYFTNSDADEQYGPDAAPRSLAHMDPQNSFFMDDLTCHVPVRQRSRLSRLCWRLQRHPAFEATTMILIVINTIVMASEYHGMTAQHEAINELVNVILSMYFAVEMGVKLVGLRWRGYIEDRMNVFDGVVVVASLVEITLTFTPIGASLGGSLSILRTFRLMRVFKLARSWKELNKIINTIFKSLSSIAYLSLILLLFIFITALLGMQLFGYKFTFCDAVEGSSPQCPPGLEPLKDCPSHFDCYLPCSEAEVGTWTEAPGSPYNDRGLCERFPRSGGDPASVQYLAQVGKSTVSRHNFDTIYWSVITIFQILTGENWNEVMYDGMRSTTYFASLYFLLIVVLGNYIILNLFLAILLDNFAGVSGDDDSTSSDATSGEETLAPEELTKPSARPENFYNSLIPSRWTTDEGDDDARRTPESDDVRPPRSLGQASRSSFVGKGDGRLVRSCTSVVVHTNAADKTAALQAIKETLRGRSLFVFSAGNPVRLVLAMVVGHRMFERAIIGLICLSSLTLAVDSPNLDPDSRLKAALNIIDTIFVVVFAAEAAIKIIVFGFVVNGKDSYIRNPWNVLDFVIVVVGVVLLMGSGSNQTGLESLRSLRTLRALRPIRMASRNEGMKVVVNALFQSVPPIFNVVLVCLLFFIIFGILGLNLLKGRYYYCADENGVRFDPDYVLPRGSSINRTWCQEGTHIVVDTAYHSGIGSPEGFPSYEIKTEWLHKEVNFDNIGRALMALFEMATLEMWLDVMYDGVDAAGVDEQPIQGNNPFICVFFILFIIVGSFFVLNLFVGVTIDKFNEMQQKQEGRSLLLTTEQEQWLHIQKQLAITKPVRQYIPPKNPVRQAVFNVVTSRTFDGIIMGTILLNIAFMALQHADMSDAWSAVLFTANLTFTGLYTAEAVAKLFALGVSPYFKDGWNAFDFSVIAFSYIGLAVDLASDEEVPVVSLLRVFRVARIFRLIPKAKGLRTLFQTLVYSLPALVNVGSVLFLFFFIFAIMGMNLFGMVRHGEFLNRHTNFESFPQALLVLFRMATGESWNGIMHDCMHHTECIEVTEDWADPVSGAVFRAGDYLDHSSEIVARIPPGLSTDRCPPLAIAAIVYFYIFVVVCAFILLNLVIAVILDNFQSSSQNEEMPVGRGHLLWFVEVWSDLDPHATNYIPAVKLSTLLSELEPPLGVRGTAAGTAEIQSIIMSVDIPNRNNKVHFLETLHALAGRVAGTQLPEEEEQIIHEKMYTRLPDDLEFPKYTAAHFYAALYVQAAVRGFLARHQMKAVIEEFNAGARTKGEPRPPEPDVQERKSRPRSSIIWDNVKDGAKSINAYVSKHLKRKSSRVGPMEAEHRDAGAGNGSQDAAPSCPLETAQ